MPASPRVAIGTVATPDHLPRARVLARSLRKLHPDLRLAVLVIEEPDRARQRIDDDEPFEVVRLDQLGLDATDLSRRAFDFEPLGLASSLKPVLLRWLHHRDEVPVLHLDADLLVVGPLGPLLEAVASHAVVVVPHLLGPLEGPDAVDRELAIIAVGTFNGGVVGFDPGRGGADALAWWEARCAIGCRHDLAGGVFYDQRWLDLLPDLFDDVHVVRDPGVDVAYWELPERRLRLDGGRLVVGDGQTARLLHLSGFDPDRPTRASRYTDRDSLFPTEVLRSYAAALRAEDRGERGRPPAFGAFADGVPIPAEARQVHAGLGDDGAGALDDPFAVGAGSFRSWLAEPVDGHGGPDAVSRLWAAVHAARADLQTAHPDPLGAGRRRFVDWLRSSSHSVPVILRPEAVATFEHFDDGTVVPPIAWDIWREDVSAEQAAAMGDPRRTGPDTFRAWLAAPADGRDGPDAVGNLWLGVHRRRADVSLLYPDPLGADRAGFLSWVHGSGPSEVGATGDLLPPTTTSGAGLGHG